MAKKKKSKKKLFIIIGVIVVVLILIAVNMRGSGRGVFTVTTTKIDRQDVESIVSGSGRIQPKISVDITSEVNAEVIALPVKAGDRVERGQVLIQLDTVQLKSDLDSYMYATNELEARLEGAVVMLDQAEEELARQTELFQKKLTSEQAFKDAGYNARNYRASYEAMRQQHNAAISRLEKARDNLNKTTIRSPMDGIVTLIDVEVGEIAQAQTAYSPGRTLMTVADLSEFEVEVEIDETDIAYLDLAQKAAVEIDAFPDTSFAGTVAEISNTALVSGLGTNDQATNFKVTVTLLEANPKIRPGMSATVDITTNEHSDVITVPIQAVVLREAKDEKPENKTAGDQVEGNVANAATGDDDTTATNDETKKEELRGVFVNDNGTAKFVEIETGIADQQNYEVLSGLEEGVEVITGSFRTLRTIKDGDPIKVDNAKRGGRGDN